METGIYGIPAFDNGAVELDLNRISDEDNESNGCYSRRRFKMHSRIMIIVQLIRVSGSLGTGDHSDDADCDDYTVLFSIHCVL